MQKGIAAPRYDSYARSRSELGRGLWNRDNSLPPYLMISSLWTVPIPDFNQLTIYVNFRIREANELLASGQSEQAEQSLQELNAFGQRMAAANQATIETISGADISRKALRELHSFYVTIQRSKEAATTATELDELEAQREAKQAVARSPSRSFTRPLSTPSGPCPTLHCGFAILRIGSSHWLGNSGMDFSISRKTKKVGKKSRLFRRRLRSARFAALLRGIALQFPSVR